MTVRAPSPGRAWLHAALGAAVLSSVLLVVIASGFGVGIALYGGMLLLLPTAAIGAFAEWFLSRSERSLPFALVTLTIGWVVVIVISATLGLLTAGIDRGIGDSVRTFLTWLMLLSPFVVFGGVISVLSYGWQWRRARVSGSV